MHQNYGWPYKDNDFYQELWLHLAASGVGQFLYLCVVRVILMNLLNPMADPYYS